MKEELGSLIYFYEGMPDKETLEGIVQKMERPLILAFDDLSLDIDLHIVDLFQVLKKNEREEKEHNASSFLIPRFGVIITAVQ